MIEYYGITCHHICCHTSERMRKGLIAHRVVVGDSKFIESVEQILPINKTRTRQHLGECPFTASAYLNTCIAIACIALSAHIIGVGDIYLIPLLSHALRIGLHVTRHTIAQQHFPVLRHKQRVHLIGRIAYSIQSAYDGSHARARHIVDRNLHLLNEAYHPHMRRPSGTATTQH